MTPDELTELYYLVRSLSWNTQIGQLADEAQQELTNRLLTLQRELKKRLADEVKQFGYVTSWTADMSADVTSWLSDTLASGTASTTEFLSSVSVGAALASVDEFNSILSFSGKATGVKLAKGLTAEQIQQFFVEQPLGGRLLNEWVQGAFDNGAQASILKAFREGVVAGEGYDKLLERVERATDIGFIRTRQEMLSLVRTYVQSANTGAFEAVCQQNEDVIRGYKRHEAIDNRTCRQCSLCDGLEYKLNEKRPALPAHPGCRGTYTPLTKSWRELGVDIDEFNEELRHWAIREDGSIGTGGKKVLSYGSISGDYGDWFKGLSDADKAKTSIGTIRTALLRGGQVKWRDMVDKKTGLVKPLRELGFTQGGQRIFESQQAS